MFSAIGTCILILATLTATSEKNYNSSYLLISENDSGEYLQVRNILEEDLRTRPLALAARTSLSGVPKSIRLAHYITHSGTLR